MAAGALLCNRKDAVLILADVALFACGKARVGAPLLAAMAEIAELQPYSAPPLPQAQPVQALTPGVQCRSPDFVPLLLECQRIA